MYDPDPHEEAYELEAFFAASQVFDLMRTQYRFLSDDLAEFVMFNMCGLHVLHPFLRFRLS